MPEILTESFCERCGTRYTFESVTPKVRPLKKLRVLSKGLKNYVLSDETTLDEAFADARNDEQRSISSQQLDAFHKTFNFCMTCRQYTCGNCWNQAEGRCLTCAPHLGHEILPGPYPTVDLSTVSAMPTNGNGLHDQDVATIAASAWPVVDLRVVEAPTHESLEATGLVGSSPEVVPTVGDGVGTVSTDTDAAPSDATVAAAPGGAAESASTAEDAEPEIAPSTELVPATGLAAAEGEAQAGAEAGSTEPTAEHKAEAEPAIGPVVPLAAAVTARSAASAAGGVIAPAATTELPDAGPSSDEHAAAGIARTASLFARFRPRREREETEIEGATELAVAPGDLTAQAPIPADLAEPTTPELATPAAAAGPAPIATEAASAPTAAEAGTAPDSLPAAAQDIPTSGVEPAVAAAGVVLGAAALETAAGGASAVGGSTEDATQLAPQAPAADEGLTAEELAAVSLAAAAAVARRASRRDETPRRDVPEAPPATPIAAVGPPIEAAAASAPPPAPSSEAAPIAATAADAPSVAGLDAESTSAGPAAETPTSAPAAPPASPAPEPIAGEPVAAEPIAPQPIAAEPAAEAVPLSPVRPDDVVETPTWRIVAPDTADGVPAPAGQPATVPAPTSPAAYPAWPVQQGEPQWPSTGTDWTSAPAPWTRPASPGTVPVSQQPQPPMAEGVWTASSRDVLGRPGTSVQACVNCGLPLSATARFCRRCGTRQG